MMTEGERARFVAMNALSDAIARAATIIAITAIIITVIWVRAYDHQSNEKRKEDRIEACMVSPDQPTPEPGCNQ